MKIFRRRQFERDMDDELLFHLEQRIDHLVRSGMDRPAAERLARVEFGGIQARKEECREAWGLQPLDDLRADLRLTFRTLRQNPGFAAIAILSLALGIGANTAIFGLVDAVVLRMFPVRDPGRLVFIENVGTQGANGGPPYPCFELFRDKSKSYDGMAAFSPSNMELQIDDSREQVRGVWVSGNFYDLLGVKPLLGRALSASDDQTVGKGGPDGFVVVISDAYWRQRFGGNRDVIGRHVQMFERTATIIGVMPEATMSLDPGRPIDVAAPMMLSDPATLRERSQWWFDIVARLKPQVRPEQARAESDALFQAFMADVDIPRDIRKFAFDHIELFPAAWGMDHLRKQFSKPLAALVILAGLVLLAACANIANLMLARATARQKEFAVRLALGAGRGRLIRQTLTEALVLVAAGCALGIGLARQGEEALASFFAAGNDRILLDLSMNARLILFSLAISASSALLFGLLPALRSARVDPASGLQGSSRTFAGSRLSLRLGRALVVLQVALSSVLLAGAGLFIHSLRQLKAVDLGFVREGVLTMEITPEKTMFGRPEWFNLQTEILDRVRRLPGVRSASWSTMTPLSGRDRGVMIEAPEFIPKGVRDKEIHLLSVSPDFFETFGVPLLHGRLFKSRDGRESPRVCMLNEAAARFYLGQRNPLGTRLRFPRIFPRPGQESFSCEVVGVVKDVRHHSLREQPWRFVFLPIPQSFDRINRLALAVHVSGDPMSFATPVRRQVQSARPTLLITNVSTIEKQVELSLLRERLVSTLSAAFGALALVLAAIGLYGILAHAVARRTSEIGIRMALGATSAGMVRMVLREALALAAAGIALGIPAALALGRVMKALLYGVEPFDLPTLAAVAALLLAFATLAGIVPARRASRLDPMSALRCE